jgi:glycosyltransferase involved in cell wall biosynthesis
MKLYFVYATPSIKKKSLFYRGFKKLIFLIFNIPTNFLFLEKKNKVDFSNWPVQSPYENTRNIFIKLNSIWPSYLFNLYDKYSINFNKNDIFLGHPFFPISKKHQFGITELALKSKKRPKVTALITPLHCNLNIKTSHINDKFLNHINDLMPNCDILFSIMGEYWWDQWKTSNYAHWQNKMIRLDMAIDINRYPFVRKSFNPKGKRKFLFIGRNDTMKGTDFLSKLAFNLPNYEFAWIGNGSEIMYVTKISDFRQLTPEFMFEIAKEYDFFISTSIADPNPTTILESMAWGFPVLSTIESGYYQSNVINNIYNGNLSKSILVLEKFQYLDNEILDKIAFDAREYVIKNHNWNKITDIIVHNIDKIYNKVDVIYV